GAEYVGEWMSGLRQGRGKQIWANGSTYDGQFYEDAMEGMGVLRYANGDVYQGIMHDGQRHGKGMTLTLPSRYEGEWLRDRRHGEG
ncbi:hypothetical protein GUITHDRAFT_59319, partial [Guillardia theta CCMP2712]